MLESSQENNNHICSNKMRNYEDEITLVDSSEFHKPEPEIKRTVPDKEPEKEPLSTTFKKILFSKYAIYVVLWYIGLVIINKYHFAQVYVVITGLLIIFLNLGKRKEGELSAYSVFNKDGKKLAGEFDTNQIERNLRGGAARIKDEEPEEEDKKEEYIPQMDLNKISKMANQPCYCGSGKKYKKCCYWRELRQRQTKK